MSTPYPSSKAWLWLLCLCRLVVWVYAWLQLLVQISCHKMLLYNWLQLHCALDIYSHHMYVGLWSVCIKTIKYCSTKFFINVNSSWHDVVSTIRSCLYGKQSVLYNTDKLLTLLFFITHTARQISKPSEAEVRIQCCSHEENIVMKYQVLTVVIDLSGWSDVEHCQQAPKSDV